MSEYSVLTKEIDISNFILFKPFSVAFSFSKISNFLRFSIFSDVKLLANRRSWSFTVSWELPWLLVEKRGVVSRCFFLQLWIQSFYLHWQFRNKKCYSHAFLKGICTKGNATRPRFEIDSSDPLSARITVTLLVCCYESYFFKNKKNKAKLF